MLAGFGCGLGSAANVAYMSEVAPAARRGALTGGYELLVATGVLCAFLVYFLVDDVDGGWRILLGLAALIALAQVRRVRCSL